MLFENDKSVSRPYEKSKNKEYYYTVFHTCLNNALK